MSVDLSGEQIRLVFSFLLVLARVVGVFSFVPMPGARIGPDMARIILSLSITVSLFPRWPQLPWADPTLGQLVGAVLTEAAFGLTVGLVVAFLMEALGFGAQVLSLQAGFSYASTIDPTTQAESGVMTVIAQLLSGLLFFSTGLDRQTIRIFIASIDAFPPGAYQVTTSLAEQVIRLGTGMFITGVKLVFPILILLIAVDAVLALLGRLNGQIQLLALVLPAKILITILALSWLLVLAPRLFTQNANHMLAALQALLPLGFQR